MTDTKRPSAQTEKRSRSTAQRRAEQRNDAKRRGSPRLPASRLSEYESQLLDEAAALVGGSKKDAIFAGLRELLRRKKEG